MPFDRYRVEPTSSKFEEYYDAFLQNTMRRRRYRVELSSGDSAIGIPTSGSFANPGDPDVSFDFQDEKGAVFRIPFRDLERADPVDFIAGSLRTVSATTAAADDVPVLLERTDSERIMQAGSTTTVTVTTEVDINQVMAISRQRKFKYLTALGGTYQVEGIQPSSVGHGLVLTITPVRDGF